MIGALQELATYQPLEFPKGLYGISVGSILATALAYRIPVPSIRELFQDVSMDSLAPSIRLQQLIEAPRAKGMYSMESLESHLLSAFRKHGIDLETATMGDAPQPLYIIASNITRCTPTIFSGNVRTLDAIKASCAIPGFFQPQVIFDSVYVDGGLYVPSIIEILPAEVKPETLILNLARPRRGVSPAELAEMPPHKYLERLYQSSVEYRMKSTTKMNCVWLKNEETHSMQALTADEKSALIDSGGLQLRAFWSKLVNKP